MIHFQLRSRYIWYSFFSFYHSHISLGVMDRQGISSPVFDNNDDMNNYITKASIFDLQRQVQGAQSRLRERIENLSIDIRHSEARKKGLHRQQAFCTKGGARCKDGGDSSLDQVYFPFVIFKAAATKSIIFGAQTRCKRKSSTSTTPWRPQSRS